jgi:hypothetical protein
VAAWSIGIRDRIKAWLGFVGFAIVVIGVFVFAKVDPAWAIAGLVASAYAFEWWLTRSTSREWQRYYHAGGHFQALLESRKTLQSMSKEQRAEVKPEVVKFLLSMFMQGGIERGVLWEEAEQGVMYPATRRMKLEIMGVSRREDKNLPTYKEVEYAWDRYGEIDPEREWIVKLRVIGGYVDHPSEKMKKALEDYQKRWNPKPPEGSKQNA